jgi:hypothetical protein
MHNNDPRTLADTINNFNFINMPYHLGNLPQEINYFDANDTLFINTWYGTNQRTYLNQYSGCTFDALYFKFDDIVKGALSVSLQDINNDPFSFFPNIDFSHFEISNVDKFMASQKSKKVFISNGKVQSYQSSNFPYSPIINSLAEAFSDILFIISNKEGSIINKNNIVYSSDIINKSNGCDLNENSRVSEYCDVVIGRHSGAFTYSITQNNMMRNNAKFICTFKEACDLVKESTDTFWLGPHFENIIKYNAKTIGKYEEELNMFVFLSQELEK